MIYNKLKLETIPKPYFAHVYSCPGYEVKLKKTRPDIEIAYIKKGELTLEILGKEYIVRENSFLVLPHNHKFNIRTPKNEAHIHYTISAIIDENGTLENSDAKCNENEILVPIIVENEPRSEKCLQLLHEAINEYQKADATSRIKCGVLMAQLICELSGKSEQSEKKTNEKADTLDSRIKKYIEKNIASKILLQDIGDAMGKNPNYLNQFFKKRNNMSIISYINLEKMKKVAVLISDNGLSVKNAAKEVGISDVNYLSRLFKQKMGMSVSQYKLSSVDYSYSLNNNKL